MNFQAPSPKHYFSGLAILAIIATLLFFIRDNASLQSLGVFGSLITGLFIGHLLASFFPDSGKSATATSNKNDNEEDRKTIYVGNIAYNANNHELEKLFSGYGAVYSARIMTDRVTRKPRGYGFVEMDRNNADKAISSLNGKPLNGRALKVGEANERNAY